VNVPEAPGATPELTDGPVAEESRPLPVMRRVGESALATRANVVTVGRLILAVPTLFLIVRWGASWTTAGLWFLLSVTDGVDGWLARRDGTTRSGAFLDPLADKVLTIGGMVALVVRGAVWWLPVALIAAREVFVSIYRALAGRRGISLPARQLGKWKAVLQMVAVGVYLFPPFDELEGLRIACLWVAVAFTIVSGLDIVRRGWGAVEATA
jgi:CDP-diacylglycerol--glycerol-3-phosphate 3-phosphatidyltransferase